MATHAEDSRYFKKATLFVEDVKLRFINDEEKFKNFKSTVMAYKNGQELRGPTYESLMKLLEGHEDLKDELRFFLPDGIMNVHILNLP